MKTVSYQTPLMELGMDSLMNVEVKQTLEQKFDIFVAAQDIRSLTFAKLKKLSNSESQNAKLGFEPNQDVKEFNAIKLLARLISNYHISNVLVDFTTSEYSSNYEVFLIPGIEGCASVFTSVARKITASATCLQYGVNNIGNECVSITEIADCLFKVRITFIMHFSLSLCKCNV